MQMRNRVATASTVTCRNMTFVITANTIAVAVIGDCSVPTKTCTTIWGNFPMHRASDMKGKRMVSDNQIQVWQDGSKEEGYVMKIQSRYLDDPAFTLEQERVIHEIVRSFLLVNRQVERRKRYYEKKKAERRTDDKR